MKKLISAVLVAAMLGSLMGCGASKEASEATTEATDETQYIDIEMDASEYVELGDYKKITVTAEKAEVTDEQIDEEIENLRYEYVEYKKTDKSEVEEGDIVNLDYSCQIDGEEAGDYEGDEYDVTIGEGQLVFSDDLDVEAALVGHKVGETVTVKGKFADDDYDEEVAGKEAEFTVTINYISEESLPEFNDAFVKENFDVDSVKEYRELLRKDLMESAEEDAESNTQHLLWEELVKSSKQIKEFPDDMVEKEKTNCVIQENEYATYFGGEIGETDEEIDSYFKETYDMSWEEYARDSLFRQAVLELLVETAGIEPTDEEIDALVEQEMEAGEYESVDEIYEYASRDDFKDQLIYTKVMELLEENATINK